MMKMETIDLNEFRERAKTSCMKEFAKRYATADSKTAEMILWCEQRLLSELENDEYVMKLYNVYKNNKENIW